MAKLKNGFFEILVSSHWTLGIVAGVVAFIAIRFGVGWYFSAFGGAMLGGVGNAASGGSFSLLAWFALGLCWMAALVAFIGGKQRARLLDRNGSLEKIRALNWTQFELLVGEAFRRQGYSVEETGLGGADGGIDLWLRRDRRRELVQCKQWRSERVGVNVVREMFGLLVHHAADRVKVVTIGRYTDEARSFAEGKAIDLIDGAALQEMLGALLDERSYLAPAPLSAASATCPRCAGQMVKRTNTRSGSDFLGCLRYPGCKGTRADV